MRFRFRFEWFDGLDGNYEVPSNFLVVDPVVASFGTGDWAHAPHHCNLGQCVIEGVDYRQTGESFLSLIQEAPLKNFVVPYDEHGFVLLMPPEGYELEEALPSNPPKWLSRVLDQLKKGGLFQEEPRRTFWEKL
jgi:hypothetical protein